jgi:multiple sugar transport system permease protein
MSGKPRTDVFDNALIPHRRRPANFADVRRHGSMLTWPGNSAIAGIAAATTVTINSTIVIFVFAQRHIIEGIATTGRKG